MRLVAACSSPCRSFLLVLLFLSVRSSVLLVAPSSPPGARALPTAAAVSASSSAAVPSLPAAAAAMTFRQPHSHQRIPTQAMSPTRLMLMMEGANPTAAYAPSAPAALSPYAAAPSAAAVLHNGSINYLPALLAPSHPAPKELPPVPSPYLAKPAAVPPPTHAPGGQKKRRGKNRHGAMMRRTNVMTPGLDGSSSSNAPSYLAQTASRRNAATPSTVLHTPPMTANSPTPYGSQMPREPLYARKFTPNNLTAIPASSNNKRLSPTAAELKHSLVTAHAVVVAEREPLPAPVFSTGPNRGGYNSGAKKSDPHNMHAPPLSPIHGTLLGDAGLAPARSPSNATAAATAAAAGAVITTTTTTSTTTTTVSPPSPGSAAAPAAVLSNTTPDLLFLLTPTEHQALMMLLRARIDGKPGGTLTIEKPSSANSSIAIAGLPPQSPTSGSLRRPSLIANPTIPAHVAAELNLMSAASNTPPSPSRSLHFAPTTAAANDNLMSHGGTLTILSTAGQLAQPVSGGPGSPAKDGSPPIGSAVPPPGAGHRGRSKSFSSRASLPRRPSLQSVREEGGAITFGGALLSQVNAGNSLVPPVLQDHTAAPVPVPAVPNEEEERREYMLRAIAGANAELAGQGVAAPSEFGATGTGPTGSPLRGSIVRRTSVATPGAPDGSDRPRASSLVVRPIGGGGLIALPPNWSRQGSHASSTHDDDDESDTESVQMEPPLPPAAQVQQLVHSATTTTTTVSHGDSTTVVDQQASRILSTAARPPVPPAATPKLTFGPGVGNVLTIEPAVNAMERRHSVSGHHQLALPTNRRQNAGRFTMGANFAAALKQNNVFGPAVATVSAAGSLSVPFPVELLNDPGLPFNQDHEEAAGQYWSLSHALLLLERIALEKALTPQLESYLTQALDSITTAQAIVTQRMGKKIAIEEKLRTHPEPVADWLAEFAGGAAVPDEALSGSHGHSSRTSSISVSTARAGLNSGSLASPPTSPKTHMAKKSSIAGLPLSPATMKPLPGSTVVITAASPSSAAAEAATAAARANDPSSSLVVLESYLLRDPILALLDKSLEWDFELFDFHEASSSHSLVLLSVALLRSTGIIDHFPSLDLDKFFAFFAAIEKGYKPQDQVPYHNAAHGADVMQGMVFFMQTPLLQSVLSPLDQLAGLVAAACHDYEHQGRNNAFMVATGNPLAILYNDNSVMESHHASASWHVLMRPECNFLSEFTVESRAEFRASFISAILHTDMTHHMSGVQEFEAAVKAKRSHGTWFSPTSKADRKMLLDMACHVSDLGNPAKPFHLAREWTSRVVEEFYRQGDAEAALGLKISPMCDRAKAAVDAQQLGFIDFVVGPLFNSWGDALEPQAIAPCLEHLKSNKAFYKSRVPPPPTPVVASTPVGSSGGSSTAASGTTSPRGAGSLSLAGSAPLALQLIAASSLRVSPWKNGGGSTRELVCWPPGSSLAAGDFTWRASSATVSAAGPFSAFPNRQRLLMILSGPGIKLQLAGESDPRLLTASDAAPTLFDGSLAAHADLLHAGVSVEDVGLIFGPSVRVVSTLKQLSQAQSHTMALRSQPRGQQILVVLLRGSVRVSAQTAASSSSSSSSAVASVSLSQPLDSAFLVDVTVDGSLEIASHAAHNSAILVFHISPA